MSHRIDGARIATAPTATMAVPAVAITASAIPFDIVMTLRPASDTTIATTSPRVNTHAEVRPAA